MPDRDAFGNPVSGPQPEVTSDPAPSGLPAPPVPARSGGGGDSSAAWVAFAFSLGGIFVIPVVLSIVGIVLGRNARRRHGPHGAATAAIWVGWLTIIFALVLLVFWLVIVAALINDVD